MEGKPDFHFQQSDGRMKREWVEREREERE
jgi:hypothetical protein